MAASEKKARDGCIFPWYFVFVGAGGDSNISVSFFGWRGERDWDISVILFLGGGRQEYFRDCLLVVCEGFKGREGRNGRKVAQHRQQQFSRLEYNNLISHTPNKIHFYSN